jgi:hypothetical protein
MSASEKQIQANRENAQKSTGPKTEEGKAAVSQNAVKHGLYATKSILNSPHITEDRKLFDLLYEAAVKDLQPESLFQELIVQRIVECMWRQRRIVAAETAHIHSQLDRAEGDIKIKAMIARRRNGFPEHFRKEADAILGPPVNPDAPQIGSPEHFAARIDSHLMPDETFSRNALRYEFRMTRELIRYYELYDRLKFDRAQRSQSGRKRKSRKINCDETNPVENDFD